MKINVKRYIQIPHVLSETILLGLYEFQTEPHSETLGSRNTANTWKRQAVDSEVIVLS